MIQWTRQPIVMDANTTEHFVEEEHVVIYQLFATRSKKKLTKRSSTTIAVTVDYVLLNARDEDADRIHYTRADAVRKNTVWMAHHLYGMQGVYDEQKWKDAQFVERAAHHILSMNPTPQDFEERLIKRVFEGDKEKIDAGFYIKDYQIKESTLFRHFKPDDSGNTIPILTPQANMLWSSDVIRQFKSKVSCGSCGSCAFAQCVCAENSPLCSPNAIVYFCCRFRVCRITWRISTGRPRSACSVRTWKIRVCMRITMQWP